MKIISYNVNGIRSALSKGFLSWLTATNADVVCLQEVKALPEQVDGSVFRALGYELHWFPAQKKGYSGVAIFSKVPFQTVTKGCGIDIYDYEGRVMRMDFEDFSVMNVYMPSGSSGEVAAGFQDEVADGFSAVHR